MDKTVYLGDFDAEKFWRYEDRTKLPEIKDESSDNIVFAMDELLFPLCKANDLLITKLSLKHIFLNYLNNLGFLFKNNSENLIDSFNDFKEKCVFKLLNEKFKSSSYFSGLMKDITSFDTYAVLPYTAILCKSLGINYGPEIEIVKKVNSKIYSHELYERIGLKKYGVIINSSNEIEDVILKIDNGRGVMLKDPFGVSGKGSIVISSQKIMKTIIKYIASQEEKGLKTQLLLEPYLEKLSDFSCQMFIDPSGKHEIISIQNIFNQNLSYSGSMTADNDFNNFLDNSNYFEIMKHTAEEMYKDGYYGNVCVDSMILKNNEIIPIVEINARKSMGFINYNLDKYLAKFSCKSYLLFFTLGYGENIEFEDILNKFDESGLLFKPDKRSGIIFLSCNTLFVNRDFSKTMSNSKLFKGKLYVSVVSDTQDGRLKLIEQAKEALKSLSFILYN